MPCTIQGPNFRTLRPHLITRAKVMAATLCVVIDAVDVWAL